jgi:hypothetical protein
MPFPQQWADEEKTLIFVRFPEAFTWDEYHESVTEMVTMINSVGHVVDVIADVSNSRLPRGNPFPHFNSLVSVLPPNSGAIINYGASGIERTLASAFLYVYNRRFDNLSLHVVGTLEEAQTIVARRRKQAVRK